MGVRIAPIAAVAVKRKIRYPTAAARLHRASAKRFLPKESPCCIDNICHSKRKVNLVDWLALQYTVWGFNIAH